MRDRRRGMAMCVVAALLGAAAATAQAQAPRYHVGRPLHTSDARPGDYVIAPDGSGLPPGQGTVVQGRIIYDRSCASCHGDHGQGLGEYPALVGGRGTLTSNAPVQTVGSYWPYATTVWDYIHRAMPYPRAGSLRDDEVYAVTAYILYLNRIVPANAELSQRNLAMVRMPNRDGFVPDPRPEEKPRSARLWRRRQSSRPPATDPDSARHRP